MAELTPMMRQYMEIKEQNPDSILFFRLGDFYEMFGPDARTASRELDLALTTRDKDKTKSFDDKIPMCGIPYHASDAYIARLIAKGYKVGHLQSRRRTPPPQGAGEAGHHPRRHPGHRHRRVLPQRRAQQLPVRRVSGRYRRGSVRLRRVHRQGQATVFTGPDRVRALLNELGRFSPAEAVLNETAFFNETLHQTLQDRFSCHMEKLSDARFTRRTRRKRSAPSSVRTRWSACPGTI